MKKILLLSAGAVAVSGCATITRGTTENITFNSEPPAALAQTSTGQACQSTPCTLEMNRKIDFIVTYSKAGYLDQQVQVGTKLGLGGGTALAGNIVAGGLVGVGVDSVTGAAFEHYPNPVFVTLEPEKSQQNPQVAQQKRIRRHGSRTPISSR